MVKVYFKKLGNTLNADLDFKKQLKLRMNLHEVFSEIESDVIITFVPIVSRAGTDIEAALKKIPESQRIVLVVLHHTFDPYFVAPVSRMSVNRRRVFIVDCLFHEDRGLLRCERNDEALKAVQKYLKAGRSSPSMVFRFQIPEHAWWIIIISLISCFVVIVYIYDREELIISTDPERKAETIQNINHIFHENISQNINQKISEATDQIIDSNITENQQEYMNV